MLTIEDESMVKAFDKSEKEDPSPRKKIDDKRTIYKSRRFDKPKKGSWGLPILCDFGEARIGDIQETGPFVQPDIYRAPEVIFEMPWGPPVDIWNVGALVRAYSPFHHDSYDLLCFRSGIFLKAAIYLITSWTKTESTIHSYI